VPLHAGNGFVLAETGGAEDITLTVSQITAHTHPKLVSSSPANASSPVNNILGQGPDIYAEQFQTSNLNPAAITPVGGSQPHTNMQPYLGLNFIISLFGIFPSPT
jgi:microcystin-dependent protein